MKKIKEVYGDQMKIIGIIPARYGSTRFPGKPLADIHGKPMIWWVYQQAAMSKKTDGIVVALDDKRIAEVCYKYSIPFVMTAEHPTAAHRLYEVSKNIDCDYYIQINGDEPLISYDLIDLAIPDYIPTDIEFGSNVIAKITDAVELMDPSNIKVVCNEDDYMVYMSRNTIPYSQGHIDFDYFKHVGIIGYTKKMLDFYYTSQPGYYEKIEGIDTLRFIDYNKPLKTFKADVIGGGYHSLSVDTESDLAKVRLLVKNEIDKGNIPFFK